MLLTSAGAVKLSSDRILSHAYPSEVDDDTQTLHMKSGLSVFEITLLVDSVERVGRSRKFTDSDLHLQKNAIVRQLTDILPLYYEYALH